MDKRGTRGIALGLLLSALCLIGYQYLNPEPIKQTTNPVQSGETEIDQAEYAKLQNEVRDWQKKYEELESKHEKAAQKDQHKAAEDQSKSFQFTIEEGMSSKEISEQLKTAGVIQDSEDFNDYLEAKELQTKIRTGTFEVTKEMSYHDVANVLTKQQ
ncbi:endolytic transglycosylase MltG [Lederbergia sp. NSJ-179]|uniref:endolytic transglycosylase MltG n=1 Tax=Lederbergia sp. NSJ-179 TaxID=2931402 RepID=UPI001FD5468B|nr:endolytic transglycosylase MltG [Lederbergia sp. NSJ-179]MCJ7843416.1 endolytic transglycosylase MltG [Lederbergia sp. NSJ-179]